MSLHSQQHVRKGNDGKKRERETETETETEKDGARRRRRRKIGRYGYVELDLGRDIEVNMTVLTDFNNKKVLNTNQDHTTAASCIGTRTSTQ